MSKVAIVGVEGSGKTVLMAALGDKYSDYDEFGFCLSPENADAFGFVAVQMDLMRRGQWPMNTDPHAVVAMNWKISRRRGADSEGVSDLTFLDFGGEIYRRTFGDVAAYDDAGDFSAQCEALRSHVQGADALIVLVNMSDVLDGDIKNRRVREACWLSKGILDEATRNLGIKNVAIAFTQADAYRDIIEREGGIRNVYRRHPRLRHVSNVYPALPVFAVSAVNRTFVDGKGIRHPAPDFKSEGLSDLMEWIIGCVPGQERTIPDLVEAPMLAFGKALNAKNAYLRGFGGKREERLQSLADAETALAEMDAAMARCSRRVPNNETLVALQAEIASCRTVENQFDAILDKVTAKSTTEAEGALATLAESHAVVQTNMNAFKRDLADRQARLRAPIREKRNNIIVSVFTVLLIGAAIWGLSVKCQHDKCEAEKARIAQAREAERIRVYEAEQRRLAPTVRLTATVYGREVAARAVLDGKSVTLPTVIKDLPKGGTWPGSDVVVTYSEGDRNYKGTLSCAKVDWQMQKDVVVSLSQVREDGLYKVVDLASGWVEGLDAVPAGGWTEEHKTSKLVLRRIEPGTFTMGSPAGEDGRTCDESLHEVTLTRPFYIGVFEVTMGQWRRVMGGTLLDQARKKYPNDEPSKWCGNVEDNLPMYYVNWNECVAFCSKVKLKKQRPFRLPTEAEWEYACRAGSHTAVPGVGCFAIIGKSNAPALDGIAWYSGNSSVGFAGRGCDTGSWTEKQYPGGFACPRVVGTKEANGWGLHDMIGNVCEWCSDRYGAYSGNVTDPTGAASGANRVYRGGGWGNFARSCRSASRGRNTPDSCGDLLGFRVCCSAGPSE